MKQRQAGFSVVLMLAVILVVGSLLAVTVSLNSGAQAALAQDIAAHRVQLAAQTGLEWARYRIRTPAGGAACQPVRNFNVTLGGQVRVTVNCVATAVHNVGAGTVTTYALTSSACVPPAGGTCPNPAGGPHYVQAVVTGIEER